MLGLSSALLLQESLLPKPNIIIIARDLPGDESIDYATPWSGAHYRPIPDATPQGLREAGWAEKTYEHFKSYATNYPEAGIRFMKGVELLETPTKEYINTVGRYAEMDDFRVLESGELPSGVEWGASYTTFCVNTPVYLAHLTRKFILDGGQIVRRIVESLSEAFTVTSNVSSVVNCSGVGFDDPKCFITRGMSLWRC